MSKNGGVNAGKSTPGHLGGASSTSKPGASQWSPKGESPNTEYAKGNAGPGTYNPGVPNPTVAPFMTPEDLMAYAAARQQYEEGLGNLDYNYTQSAINTGYEEGEVEKGRIGNKASANDDLAARGLFRSSVRDGDLADIDATAEIRRKFLSDNLTSLHLYTEAQKEHLNTNWTEYEKGKSAKEVQNAQGVQANMPKFAVEPSWSKAAPAAPKPAAPTNKANNKPTFGVGQPINPSSTTAPPSHNGGTQAPTPNPSIGNKQAKSTAKHIAGKMYG
jgi:hypothetical protein